MKRKKENRNNRKRMMQVKTHLQQGPVDPRTRARNEWYKNDMVPEGNE